MPTGIATDRRIARFATGSRKTITEWKMNARHFICIGCTTVAKSGLNENCEESYERCLAKLCVWRRTHSPAPDHTGPTQEGISRLSRGGSTIGVDVQTPFCKSSDVDHTSIHGSRGRLHQRRTIFDLTIGKSARAHTRRRYQKMHRRRSE